MTRLLAEAGYVCGLSGKLHLSACEPVACQSVERRIADGYGEFHWSHHPWPDNWPGHNQYALWLNRNGRTCETQPHPRSKHVRICMAEEWHHTTWCTERAINFVRNHADDDRPWLLSLNLFDPHHPFDPPEAYLRRYEAMLDEIPPPNYTEGELADKSVFQQIDQDGAYGRTCGYPFSKMTLLDHQMVRAAYWAMCDLIDSQVGRLLQELQNTGQAKRTLIIYMSDHGELLGDHGIYLKGPFFYEPSIRLPLIISHPNLIAPRRIPALVELTDLAPTLLDAVGLPYHAGMQGRSLWPLLTGVADATKHRDDVYCEYYNALRSHRNPVAHMTMLRTARHKIVVDHSGNDGELYDLQTDPTETQNLWNDPGNQTVRSDLLLRRKRSTWTW